MFKKQHLIFFIFLIGNSSLWCQLNEDFSDGDLENNVFWQGDTDDFRVNENEMLQLNAPEAGETYIYTQTNIGFEQSWEFYVKLDFAPSNSNFSKIYLALDNPDPDQANGYMMRFGESNANDAIEIYELNDGNEQLIARATDGAIAAQPAEARIKLTQIADNWTLEVDYSTGTNFTTELNFDTSFKIANYQYFGIYCKYTATRTEDFFYDDIFIPDLAPPIITDAEISDPKNILLCLSEALVDLEISQVSISPSLPISDVVILGETEQKAMIEFDSEINSGTLYTVCLTDILDFSGNINPSTCFDISFVQDPAPGELIVNEILFDPYQGQDDFIEIFNTTDKILSLEHIKVANQDKSESNSISVDIIEPGQYLAFTASANSINDNYNVLFPENLIEQTIPSFNNSDGNFSLIFDDGNEMFVLDSFDYQEEFHFDLIDDTEGISLERISSSGDSNDFKNWHSCSENAGFATPGYQNSQFVTLTETNNNIALNEHLFSPNGDGDKDLLIINFNFQKSGFLLDLNIYDESGYLVRNLERSFLPSSTGFVQWDGIDDEGSLANIGVYILHASGFHPDGDLINEKLVFILADYF